MMRLKFLAAMSVVLMGVLTVLTGSGAYAVSCPTGTARQGDTVASLAECNLPDREGEPTLMDTVVKILNVVVGVVGVVTVAMIIVGGVFYTTSIGDAAKTKRALHTIMYGVVGLFVCLLAFAIVNFVLGAVFSSAGGSGGDDDEGDEGGYVQIYEKDIA